MSEFRATEGIDPNEARMNRALAVAYRRDGRSAGETQAPTTLGELVEGCAESDGDEVARVRSETVVRMLHFLFQDGPHPGSVTRLVYLLAQRLSPGLILRMNGSELADMLGETRAAWSARNKRIFTGYMEARGSRAARGLNQKSTTVCEKYARAQLGNQNRRGKTLDRAT